MPPLHFERCPQNWTSMRNFPVWIYFRIKNNFLKRLKWKMSLKIFSRDAEFAALFCSSLAFFAPFWPFFALFCSSLIFATFCWFFVRFALKLGIFKKKRLEWKTSLKNFFKRCRIPSSSCSSRHSADFLLDSP